MGASPRSAHHRYYLHKAGFGIAWINDPSGPYEPFIVVACLVFAVADMYRRLRKPPEPNAKDLELFRRYSDLFGPPHIIRFFKEHDFLGSFERENVRALYEFVEGWDNADHSFVDPRLEKARRKVYGAASALANAIVTYTTPRAGSSRLSVKPENLPDGPTPQWVLDDGRKINEAAPGFVDEHEALIKLGRKRLYA